MCTGSVVCVRMRLGDSSSCKPRSAPSKEAMEDSVVVVESACTVQTVWADRLEAGLSRAPCVYYIVPGRLQLAVQDPRMATFRCGG